MTTPIPPSLPAEDLRDDFSAGSLDTEKWAVVGDVAVTDGKLVLTPATSGGIPAQVTSVESYDLTGSYMAVEIVSMSDDETSLYLYAFNGALDIYLEFQISGGGYPVRLRCNATYLTSSLGETPTLPYYLRFREASGTTYWDFSSDGATWENMASQPTPGDLTAMQFEAQALSSTGVAWSATLDNYNVVPG